MKVVQINAVYYVGSTGRSTMEAHEYLTENGIGSYVFVGANGKYPKNVFQIGNTFERKIHGILSRLFGLQGYYSYFLEVLTL